MSQVAYKKGSPLSGPQNPGKVFEKYLKEEDRYNDKLKQIEKESKQIEHAKKEKTDKLTNDHKRRLAYICNAPELKTTPFKMPGLSRVHTRINNTLARYSIFTVSDVLKHVADGNIAVLRNIGDTCIVELEKELASRFGIKRLKILYRCHGPDRYERIRKKFNLPPGF
jgi:hypothetical protein